MFGHLKINTVLAEVQERVLENMREIDRDFWISTVE